MTSLPAPVVSTQWLADYLGADKLVVLDVSVVGYIRPNGTVGYRSGHESFITNGHLPGAFFADVIQDLSDPAGASPFTRPGAERFANAIGALGIDNETTVVVYDSAAGQWAARVWWLFRTFGYDKVAVLDGGLTTWNLEERATEVGPHDSPIASFSTFERPDLWVDKEFVDGVLRGEIDAALVCAVTAAKPPGSVSIPAASLVDDATHAFASKAELRKRLAPALGQPRIVVYGGGGIAAAADALALTVIGETSLAIYDDALSEWAADAEEQLLTTG